MKISAETKICAVIGDPVGHSMSPQIHNAAFQALGLDYVYVAFHVKRGLAADAVKGVRALGIKGLSITIPHKLDVIPHLDEIDEVAEKLGSVNTIVNNDGRLKGYSTDGPGALRALEASGVKPGGKKILLLGSGGAARAIAFTLAALDPRPELQILGVETDELERLREDLFEKTGISPRTGKLKDDKLSKAVPEAEILIHATPIGMFPKVERSLVPAGLIRAEQAVFDVVYNPFETQLLKDARAAGAVPVPGFGMFVQQAAIQFELWTGINAPIGIMEETVRKALKERQ